MNPVGKLPLAPAASSARDNLSLVYCRAMLDNVEGQNAKSQVLHRQMRQCLAEIRATSEEAQTFSELAHMDRESAHEAERHAMTLYARAVCRHERSEAVLEEAARLNREAALSYRATSRVAAAICAVLVILALLDMAR